MASIVTDDSDISIYNIVIHQGTTFRRNLTFQATDGTAISLGTSPSAAMKVRKSYPATSRVAAYRDNPVLYLTNTGSGGSINAISFDAPNGKIFINIPASSLASVPAGIYDYDLEVTLGTTPGGDWVAGDVVKVIAGLFEVKQEMTY